MRADRLVATVLLLQIRGRLTAAELAAETEVSVATARRDLEALSAFGVPVYPQPGRGGGWQLVGGARTDLTGLTAGEAQALFLVLGVTPGGAGARPETAAAVRKLLGALPAPFRADAENAAAAAVHVDPGRWGGAEPAAPLPLLRVLQEAVVHRRVLEVDYRSRTGTHGTRLVEPLGLVDKGGTWYLVAGTARGRRTFRVDRVASAAPTGASFERPSGLDLATEWDATAAEVDAKRSSVRATLRVPPRLVPVLRSHFGRYLEQDGGGPDRSGPEADGRVRVVVAAHLVRGLAEQLAGFGADVEVLDHPGVRSELARIGAELVRAHGGPGRS
jgi:predicted DNA-binding transcriptional regulator YafY